MTGETAERRPGIVFRPGLAASGSGGGAVGGRRPPA